MQNSKQKIKKITFIIFGIFSFSLGAIGIVIPGLPTTPFMILSSILFLKSSDKLYVWLTTHKRFGPYVVDFKDGKGITRKTKIYAQTMMIITLISSVLPMSPMYVNRLEIRIIILLAGMFSFWFVGFKIPTNLKNNYVNENNQK
tara:strand:- start:7 stop:438 length:432 start_codon:yes stop_codon:yes gene_type:complete